MVCSFNNEILVWVIENSLIDIYMSIFLVGIISISNTSAVYRYFNSNGH